MYHSELETLCWSLLRVASPFLSNMTAFIYIHFPYEFHLYMAFLIVVPSLFSPPDTPGVRIQTDLWKGPATHQNLLL